MSTENRSVWVCEHRIDAHDGFDITVCGVFSSEALAIEFAHKNIDMLDDERSWFYIGHATVDTDLFEGARLPAICVDRTRQVSHQFQPCSPPYLLPRAEPIALPGGETFPSDLLYDEDPECDHDIRDAPGGGIKCSKCPGWFCY